MSQNVLELILARKKLEIQRRLQHSSKLDAWENQCPTDPQRGKRAIEALRRPPNAPPRLIAEVKFRSPSRGVLRTRYPGEPQRVAKAYLEGGAHAISVLCDQQGFNGSLLDVRRVTQSVAVPILFKEFVLHEVQIRMARLLGAHMVLLIVRALSQRELFDLVSVAKKNGLAPVVEAADRNELDCALQSGADLIGVNARDLRTFHVDTQRAYALLDSIPTNHVAIAMSGILTQEDMRPVVKGRADAVLVGEALMRAPDPAVVLQSLQEIS